MEHVVAPVGAEHHLRAPPVVAVPDAHLAAAVLGAGRRLDAPALMSREVNMIGMAIAQGLDERGQVGATHMGDLVRRVVSRLRRLRAGLQEHPGVLDRDGGQHGGAARRTRPTTCRRTSATFGRRACTRARGRPAVAPAPTPWPTTRRRRSRTLEYAAKYKESLLYNRYQAGRDQIASGQDGCAVRVLHPAGPARPGGGRRDAAPPRVRRRARVAAHGAGDGRTRPRTRPAPGWCRPTRSLRRWRARCSTSRSTRTCASTRAGRRCARTTRPAGRCRCRWACASGTPPTPLTDDVRVEDEAARARCPRPKVTPTPYNMTAVERRGALRQRAGHRLQHGPVGRGDRARRPGASRAAARRSRSIRRRTTPTAPSTAHGRRAATVQYVAGTAGTGARFLIGGMSEAAQAQMVDVARAHRRAHRCATGTPLRKPRIGLFQPWSGSMDEGWTRWVLEQYGFEFVTLHPEDFQAPLRATRSMWSSWQTMRGSRLKGAADEARRDLAAPADGRAPRREALRRAQRPRRRAQARRHRRSRARRARRHSPGADAAGAAGRRAAGVRLHAHRGRPAGVRGVRPRRRHARVLQRRVTASRCSSSSCP